MSDECLMKQETVFSFYTQYQAVMRKFTLAGKAAELGARSQFIIIFKFLNLTYETILSRSPYRLLRNFGNIE